MSNPVEDAAKQGDGLLSRLQHPIFGAFIGSWVIWNWKIIYLLICGFKNPEATINQITNQYLFHDNGFPDPSFQWKPIAVYPTLSTISFLVFGPILHDLYVLFKKWINAWINNIEPVPKSKYALLEEENRKVRTENATVWGAYNFLRKVPIKIPNRQFSAEESLQPDELVQQLLEFRTGVDKAARENTQLKADLAEAQKIIEELKKR